MNNYKWNNPFEWLQDICKDWDENTLRAEFLTLARECDMDTLQDMYQQNMDELGYFDPVKD